MLTTFLALCFHVLGGGTPPETIAVVSAALSVTWVAMLIGRVRPSLPLLIAAIGVAQLVLHAAFSIATASATLSGAEHAGHGDGGLVVVATGGHAMWQAHAIAGILTVLAIRRGEHVLRRLLELGRFTAASLLRLVVAALAVTPRPVSVPRSGCGPSPSLARTARGIGSVVRRRGPPALVA